MLIAVVSDTHRIDKYINVVKENLLNVDILFHLGDNTDDVAKICEEFKGVVYAVQGNCDYGKLYPKEQLIEVCGKRIFLTHGDLYGVKYGMTNIYYRAKEVEADIVLFGHTHQKYIQEESGIIFMNPGSVSLPRLSGRYIGYIKLEEDKEVDIYFKEIT